MYLIPVIIRISLYREQMDLMTVQETSNKQLLDLLHEWYEEIRLYHVKEA